MNTTWENRVSGQFHHVAESSQELVEHHPFSAATAAFGLGMGLGVLIALLVTDSHRQEERDYAHRVGQQILDALTNVLPESVSRHLS